jgi:hypothetical protein
MEVSMDRRLTPLFLFALWICSMLTPHPLKAMRAYNLVDEQVRILQISPRLQWNENQGYCGEVSLISAGLYFGQYISQYDARALACPEGTQESSQLLLGANAHFAASQMHLLSHEWSTFDAGSTDNFLAWIKEQILNGHPVLMGIYMNQFRFYQNPDPNAGDPDYDHIVPVTGVASNHSFSDPSYYGDDFLYFCDNGLWGDPSNPHYKFSYRFDGLQATRSQANAQHGPVYSLPLTDHNYGIAILGVMDLNHDTVRVRLKTNVNFESPEIQEGSSFRPEPMPLTLTVTIADLEPDTLYYLYLYDRMDAVPNSHFNDHASQAIQVWEILNPPNDTFMTTYPISSDQTAVFRCVKACAP